MLPHQGAYWTIKAAVQGEEPRGCLQPQRMLLFAEGEYLGCPPCRSSLGDALGWAKCPASPEGDLVMLDQDCALKSSFFHLFAV